MYSHSCVAERVCDKYNDQALKFECVGISMWKCNQRHTNFNITLSKRLNCHSYNHKIECVEASMDELSIGCCDVCDAKLMHSWRDDQISEYVGIISPRDAWKGRDNESWWLHRYVATDRWLSVWYDELAAITAGIFVAILTNTHQNYRASVPMGIKSNVQMFWQTYMLMLAKMYVRQVALMCNCQSIQRGVQSFMQTFVGMWRQLDVLSVALHYCCLSGCQTNLWDALGLCRLAVPQSDAILRPSRAFTIGY